MKTISFSINRRLPFLLLMLIVAVAAQAVETLQSPNGKYQFTFSQKEGKLLYSLDYAGKPVVEAGELGGEHRQPLGGVGNGNTSG